MHWIIQDNLINPDTRDTLIAHVQASGQPVSRVVLIPFANELDGPTPVVAGPAFVYGSTGLGHVARKANWVPGYFEDNLNYEQMLTAYGDRALNADARVSSFEDAQTLEGLFFMRPVLDDKSFCGTVTSAASFEAFRAGVAALGDDPDATLRLSDRVVIAQLKPIFAEYRFFVIAGRVVAGSRYKQGDRVMASTDVPADVRAFAQACADCWSPNAAFAIDIADTPDGLKVLEINSANSAGFYACDIPSIVAAVNQLSV